MRGLVKNILKCIGVFLMVAPWVLGIYLMVTKYEAPNKIGLAMTTIILIGGLIFFVGEDA